MEDFELDLMIGQGPSARSVKLDLPKFTLVGATTRPGLIPAAARALWHQLPSRLLSRRGFANHRRAFGSILNARIDDGGARSIAARSEARRASPTACCARVRDYAEVEHDGHITARKWPPRALNRMEVDRYGLDEVDRNC